MMKQPFLIVTLEGKRTRLINEAQVVIVDPHEKGAYLRMSNGDSFVILSPAFKDWENDAHSRKD